MKDLMKIIKTYETQVQAKRTSKIWETLKKADISIVTAKQQAWHVELKQKLEKQGLKVQLIVDPKIKQRVSHRYYQKKNSGDSHPERRELFVHKLPGAFLVAKKQVLTESERKWFIPLI